jgi:NADH-quinone oxidoreductase subunit G
MGLAMMMTQPLEKAVERAQHESDITAIIIENDIYRSMPSDLVDSFFNKCKNIVVLDSLHNATTEKAHVLIPAATFAEADGTLVNNEGRAQSFYQVYMPGNSFIKESWKWLMQIKVLKIRSGNGIANHPDELLKELEAELPRFTGISQVSPPHNFRINGQSIPREPHRYSGRTAMLANINVSEPKPFQDEDSPLSYTMEGYKGIPPSPVIPFFWAPGWNSIQSVNKYQQEVGGVLRGGNSGVKLFKEKTEIAPAFYKDIPESFEVRQQKWFLLPQYHLFGSGELSMYTKAIEMLSPAPYISLSKFDAEELGVMNGSVVSLKVDERKYALPLKIQEKLPNGIVLVPAGLRGMETMDWGTWVKIEKEN